MSLPEHPIPLSSPGAIQGLDLRHPLRSELLPDEAIVRITEVSPLCLPLGEVRLQRFGDAWVQRCPELFAERRFVQGDGLPEASWHEQPDRPGTQEAEQLGVADQELAEVHRETAVHEVEEDELVVVVLPDADGQLVGEAANRPLPA